MNLKTRRILITGGGSGIGLALARGLAGDNRVVVAGRDTDKLERAAAAIAGLHTVHLDVTSEEQSRLAVNQVVEQLGGIDILVNSAGVLHPVDIETDAAEPAVEDEVAVNLLGSLRMTRLAMPYLRRSDDGAIVFLSSALALTAAPGLVSYAATKAAIHSIARSLRSELAGQVKVFDVLPPFVDTDLAQGIGRTKLTAQKVAAEIIGGLAHERFEIRIGQINALAVLSRLSPPIADAIVAREIGKLNRDVPGNGGSGEARI
jgi:uncharacterized oxidoreductase